jgi:two-component system invasion response regulator UvrY
MRVLVVDDHPIVREGFRRLLANAFDEVVIGEAQSAREALECVTCAPWDVVILDLSLPGRSGLDALKDMLAVRTELRVLVMTMYCEEQYAARTFRSGAAGFITKSSSPDEVVAAVRKVTTGGRYVTAALAENLVASLSAAHPPVLHDGLSDRELEVLRMLGAGKTVKEIADCLALSAKTISTYRTRLLAKMSMRTTAQLIHYALSSGLVD